MGPCNHHTGTDSASPSFPSQPFLPGNHSHWQAQPSWAQGERVGSPLLLETPPRSAWEDRGNCRKDQAGASSPWSHLPRNLGPWEAGKTMETRNPGAVLGAEGHKGRVVIILRKSKRAVRGDKVPCGASAPPPPTPQEASSIPA